MMKNDEKLRNDKNLLSLNKKVSNMLQLHIQNHMKLKRHLLVYDVHDVILRIPLSFKADFFSSEMRLIFFQTDSDESTAVPKTSEEGGDCNVQHIMPDHLYPVQVNDQNLHTGNYQPKKERRQIRHNELSGLLLDFSPDSDYIFLAVLWCQISLYGKYIDLLDKPCHFKCTWQLLLLENDIICDVPQALNPDPHDSN